VIQQNASAAEEMASTSEELTGQADGLLSTINFFQIADSIHRSMARPVAAEGKASVKVAPKPVAKVNGETKTAKQVVNGKRNGKTGFALSLAARPDKLDEEFERY